MRNVSYSDDAPGDIIPYNNFYPVVNPESPETAIARKVPLNLLKFLEKQSKLKHEETLNSIGADVANTYLQGMDSDSKSKISKIKVKSRKIMGLFSGRGLEIEIIREK